MEKRVEKALNRIKEFFMIESGSVELVGVTRDGVVKVKLVKAREDSFLSNINLIEKMLNSDIPEVKSVEAV